MSGLVVSDTGPIIHLDEADSLGLLGLFDSIAVPTVVYDELADGHIPNEFEELDVSIHETETESYPSLDPGESAALALCKELDGTFLTDDLDARDVAKEDDVEVHGSIGVVCYASAAGHLTRDEAVSTLRALHSDTSLYLSNPLLDHAIEIVENEGRSW